MAKNNKGINNYKVNFDVKEIMIKQAELALKNGIQPILPPTPDILFDASGEEVRRRQYQFYQRAGLTSGRYLENKNTTYLDNYIKALEKYPDREFWEETIERLKNIKDRKDIMRGGDFLGDILPPLRDWYPSGKGLKNTKNSSFSYKGMTDIDLASANLKSDLNESMDILGIQKRLK